MVDTGMNEIIKGLYVGNLFAATDVGLLDRFKITNVVQLLGEPIPLLPHLRYLCAYAKDDATFDIMCFAPSCLSFIHKARSEGLNVLIHCYAGVSRSVTIAIAYLMCTASLDYQQALKIVQSKRAVANPNKGFINQLVAFSELTAPQQRAVLYINFGDKLIEEDTQYCQEYLQELFEKEQQQLQLQNATEQSSIIRSLREASESILKRPLSMMSHFNMHRQTPVNDMTNTEQSEEVPSSIDFLFRRGEEVMPGVWFYENKDLKQKDFSSWSELGLPQVSNYPVKAPETTSPEVSNTGEAQSLQIPENISLGSNISLASTNLIQPASTQSFLGNAQMAQQIIPNNVGEIPTNANWNGFSTHAVSGTLLPNADFSTNMMPPNMPTDAPNLMAGNITPQLVPSPTTADVATCTHSYLSKGTNTSMADLGNQLHAAMSHQLVNASCQTARGPWTKGRNYRQ